MLTPQAGDRVEFCRFSRYHYEMATVITEECINCGACEPECPNTAIFQAGVAFDLNGQEQPALNDEVFFIVPDKCTECVGFFDYEACAAVCPVDCCVTDPNLPESEEVLVQRARELHPGKDFGTPLPSRFSPASDAGAAAKGDDDKPTVTEAAGAATSSTGVAAVASVASSPLDFDIPICCKSCQGEYTVAFRFFNPGTVLRCPHCQSNYCPTRRVYLALAERLDAYAVKMNAEVDSYNEVVETAQVEFQGAVEGITESAARDIRSLVLDLTEDRKASLFG